MGNQDYFDLLRKPAHFFKLSPGTLFSALFGSCEYAWEGLDNLQSVMTGFFHSAPKVSSQVLPSSFQVNTVHNREGYSENILFVTEPFQAESDLIFPEFQLAIGKGTVFEPSALIKPPLIVGKYTEIRQGAYIRGGALIGDHCTVGHATEVKTAVFMDHTEAGHFAYVGDSILGRCVNLGAGAKLANLPFRTLQQKEEQRFDPFDLNICGERFYTGKAKLGAILADGVEIGCNSTIAPGTIIEQDCWIYPCVFVKSGYYLSKTIIKTDAKPNMIPRR